MLDTLKSLALSYTTASGHLTLWLLPFTSMRANIAYEAFAAIVPRDTWKLPEVIFANFDSYVIDVQVDKGASPIERVFGILWGRRGDDLTARWELFQQLYSDGFFKVFNLAYEATRDRTFDASAESADPEPTPALTTAASS